MHQTPLLFGKLHANYSVTLSIFPKTIVTKHPGFDLIDIILDIGTTISTSAVVRTSRAARMVATSGIGAVNSARAIVVVMMASNPKKNKKGYEEENNVHDAKSPAGL